MHKQVSEVGSGPAAGDDGEEADASLVPMQP